MTEHCWKDIRKLLGNAKRLLDSLAAVLKWYWKLLGNAQRFLDSLWAVLKWYWKAARKCSHNIN